MRIAINGFGRIGRNFFRALIEDKNTRRAIEVVAINVGPAKTENVAYAVKYDSLMGIYAGEVYQDGDKLVVDGQTIQLLAEPDPSALPWQREKIDWVVECSGRFTRRDEAEKHIQAGAQKVLISAPAHGEDVSIIPGVNGHIFSKKQHVIVSLGSCTTNAFLPMLKVVHDAFGIVQGSMTTVHAYTNSQVLLDVDNNDARRSRAAALNIIPTTTGAAKMVGKIMPELADKVEAVALRVPVPKVSLIDLTVMTERMCSKKLLEEAFEDACRSDELRAIIGVTHEPIVSSDISGNAYSVVIDMGATDVTGASRSNMAKIFGWYDNEWAYSVRLKDFLLKAGA